RSVALEGVRINAGEVEIAVSERFQSAAPQQFALAARGGGTAISAYVRSRQTQPGAPVSGIPGRIVRSADRSYSDQDVMAAGTGGSAQQHISALRKVERPGPTEEGASRGRSEGRAPRTIAGDGICRAGNGGCAGLAAVDVGGMSRDCEIVKTALPRGR